MIALQTNSRCDECRHRRATRETDAGVFLCETCEAAPHANDDAQGASCTLLLCTRCQSGPAFFRLRGGDLCSACFAISNSNTSAASPCAPADVATTGHPPAASVVATFSKSPEALAWLLAPLRHSSCGPDSSRDLKSSGLDDDNTFDGSHTVAATRSRRAGLATSPQDSISPSASIHPDLPRNLTARAEGIPGAVSSFSVDAELEKLVTDLERGWLQSAAFPEPVFTPDDGASA